MIREIRCEELEQLNKTLGERVAEVEKNFGETVCQRNDLLKQVSTLQKNTVSARGDAVFHICFHRPISVLTLCCKQCRICDACAREPIKRCHPCPSCNTGPLVTQNIMTGIKIGVGTE